VYPIYTNTIIKARARRKIKEISCKMEAPFVASPAFFVKIIGIGIAHCSHLILDCRGAINSKYFLKREV
jgi:hypothetical protein